MDQKKETTAVEKHAATETASLVTVLAINRPPLEVLGEGNLASRALQSLMNSPGRKNVVLGGKTYLGFEDWQTLGRFFGVVARVVSTKPFQSADGSINGWECKAEAILVEKNMVISTAESMCCDDEKTWRGRPQFMVRSMAQTRACAKALRNCLSWVVVMAGYAPTPSEEMNGLLEQQPSAPPAPKKLTPKKSPTKPKTAKTSPQIEPDPSAPISKQDLDHLMALSMTAPNVWSLSQIESLIKLYPLGEEIKYDKHTDLTQAEFKKICKVVQSRQAGEALEAARKYDADQRPDEPFDPSQEIAKIIKGFDGPGPVTDDVQ